MKWLTFARVEYLLVRTANWGLLMVYASESYQTPPAARWCGDQPAGA